MYLNKAFVLGRLTRDPESRTTPNGQKVTSMSIATNRVFKGKDGSKQEQVEFHNVVMWSRLAEIAAQYLTKGQEVMIEGRIQTRSWDGQDGVKKYRTEIIAESMQMGSRAGGGKPGEFGGNSGQGGFPSKSADEVPPVETNEDVEEIKIEDIPF